jgi:hypothetical protein
MSVVTAGVDGDVKLWSLQFFKNVCWIYMNGGLLTTYTNIRFGQVANSVDC